MSGSASASCLYNTGKLLMYFCEIKQYKVFSIREPDTNFNSTEVPQDCYCPHIAGTNEGKGSYLPTMD